MGTVIGAIATGQIPADASHASVAAWTSATSLLTGFIFVGACGYLAAVYLSADAVRNEKLKVLQAVRPITPAEMHDYAVRGQYGPGTQGGKAVPGYREEAGVAPDSGTPGFWAGVMGSRPARRAGPALSSPRA